MADGKAKEMRQLRGEEETGGKEPDYELRAYVMGCPKFDEYYSR